MVLMSSIIDYEPTNFEDAANQQVWRDVMMEEHYSLMKNDVWDKILGLKGKSMVSSRWMFNIKHVVDRNIEKYKARFVVRRFS